MAKGRKGGWLSRHRRYSASSIKTFLNCELQSFYDKMQSPRLVIPTHPEFVRGNVLHSSMPNFYKPNGMPKYAPYSRDKFKFLLSEENLEKLNEMAGDFLESLHQTKPKMRKSEKLELLMDYISKTHGNKDISLSSRDEEDRKKKVRVILGAPFANIVKYKFKEALTEGTYRGQEIDMSRHKRLGEDLEKVKKGLEGEIYKIAKKVYETYYKDKPPVFAEKTITFSVVVNDMILNYIAKLDEIRYPLTIRDHKSDFLLPEEESLSLNNDIQFALYAIALSTGCSLDKEFALKCGATEKDFEMLQTDPLYLLDKIKLEHHHMRTGKITKINPKTKKDFYKIVQTTLNIEKKIAEYKEGEKHFLEIFSNKWGICSYGDNVKECEMCDYRRYHEADRIMYEAGQVAKPPESFQRLLPGFVYPEITPKEQIKLKFHRKDKADIETVLQSA